MEGVAGDKWDGGGEEGKLLESENGTSKQITLHM